MMSFRKVLKEEIKEIFYCSGVECTNEDIIEILEKIKDPIDKIICEEVEDLIDKKYGGSEKKPSC